MHGHLQASPHALANMDKKVKHLRKRQTRKNTEGNGSNHMSVSQSSEKKQQYTHCSGIIHFHSQRYRLIN